MSNTNDVEIEIKIKLSEKEYKSLNEILEVIAKYDKVTVQKDEYYTPEYRDFTREKYPFEWLSVRERGGKNILNYKHYYPEGAEKHEWCDEFEVTLDSSEKMKKIFKRLNIKSFAMINKTRYTYIYKDKYEIALDKVKDLGYFVEIEVKKLEWDYKTERKEIYRIAEEELGLDLSNIELRGYPFYYIKNR